MPALTLVSGGSSTMHLCPTIGTGYIDLCLFSKTVGLQPGASPGGLMGKEVMEGVTPVELQLAQL